MLRNSLDVEVAEKDRSKVAMIGCIYYAVAIPLTFVGSIAFICFQIGYSLSITQLFFWKDIFTFIMVIYMTFMAVMITLYLTDDWVGRHFKQD